MKRRGAKHMSEEKKVWYENVDELADAVSFLMRHACLFGWTTLATEKTPCCDFRDSDKEIPERLKLALEEWYVNLTIEKRRHLNQQFAFLLGERFFVRGASIVKILSRLLADGDPRDNKELVAYALKNQIQLRVKLLKSLNAS